MAIRIVIADGHPLVLKGLESVLGSEPDFQLLAQCANGEEALEAVRAHKPDILVLELQMSRKNGLEVLKELKADKLPTRAVLLVEELDDEELLEATRQDVAGVVLKEMAPRLLMQCIRKVHAGKPWIERRSAARAFEMLLRREAGTRELARVSSLRARSRSPRWWPVASGTRPSRSCCSSARARSKRICTPSSRRSRSAAVRS